MASGSPPVLLADDDAMTRTLSKKFFVVIDSVGPVTELDLKKHELVFMESVMPKSDGVVATRSSASSTRELGPFIWMCDSKLDEIMTYYNRGMNDILPKPFTKEGLLDMFEKPCAPQSDPPNIAHPTAHRPLPKLPLPVFPNSDTTTTTPSHNN